jgi:malonyl-CoA decarboxylase
LQRIDWNSAAALLEKLVGYEAVHEIRSWRDLKNRLDSDRRCYAFFHPRMPGEPLIFVEVALVKGLAGSVQRLLDEKAPLLDPREADTAIFYSISNCQQGLAGISFRNFLIKMWSGLSAGSAIAKTFATLSPLPEFRRWLDPQLASSEPDLLSDEESTALIAAFRRDRPGRLSWHHHQAALVAEMQPIAAQRTGAGPAGLRYLLVGANGKRARDPWRIFTSLGARVERLSMTRRYLRQGAEECDLDGQLPLRSGKD